MLTAILAFDLVLLILTLISQQHFPTEHNSQVVFLSWNALLNDILPGRKAHFERSSSRCIDVTEQISNRYH